MEDLEGGLLAISVSAIKSEDKCGALNLTSFASRASPFERAALTPWTALDTTAERVSVLTVDFIASSFCLFLSALMLSLAISSGVINTN